MIPSFLPVSTERTELPDVLPPEGVAEGRAHNATFPSI